MKRDSQQIANLVYESLCPVHDSFLPLLDRRLDVADCPLPTFKPGGAAEGAPRQRRIFCRSCTVTDARAAQPVRLFKRAVEHQRNAVGLVTLPKVYRLPVHAASVDLARRKYGFSKTRSVFLGYEMAANLSCYTDHKRQIKFRLLNCLQYPTRQS